MKPQCRAPGGFILLEVLVTIVILVIGLLGLAGFQVRATAAEREAYQRAQALILVQDMVERIYANRPKDAVAALPYLQDDIGTSGAIIDCTGKTGPDLDVCQWANALFGASETSSGAASVGTLLGGRGCIAPGGVNEYFVTVVWQGLSPAGPPVAAAPGFPCGQNDYGNEALRRVVSMRVVISTLSLGTL